MQYHRADLAANFYAGNPAFEQRYSGHRRRASWRTATSLVQAQQRAYAMLDAQMMRQASMLAYNDAWMLILLSFLVVAPAVLLLRKPSPWGAPVDAH